MNLVDCTHSINSTLHTNLSKQQSIKLSEQFSLISNFWHTTTRAVRLLCDADARAGRGFPHVSPGSRHTAPGAAKKGCAQLAATKAACIKLFPEIHEEPRTAHNADRKIHSVTAKQLN